MMKKIMKFRIFKNSSSSYIFIFENIYYFSNLYARTLTKSIVIIRVQEETRNCDFLEHSQLIDNFFPGQKLVMTCLLDRCTFLHVNR